MCCYAYGPELLSVRPWSLIVKKIHTKQVSLPKSISFWHLSRFEEITHHCELIHSSKPPPPSFTFCFCVGESIACGLQVFRIVTIFDRHPNKGACTVPKGYNFVLNHRERLNKLIARSRTNTYSLNIEELACGLQATTAVWVLCLGAACPFASTRKLWTTMGLELE